MVVHLAFYLEIAQGSVGDPDPEPDPHVFGPPGSGSINQRYGSGSINQMYGSGSGSRTEDDVLYLWVSYMKKYEEKNILFYILKVTEERSWIRS
jgi:hypothetical protein